jgi:NAD-dependent DNA ligase
MKMAQDVVGTLQKQVQGLTQEKQQLEQTLAANAPAPPSKASDEPPGTEPNAKKAAKEQVSSPDQASAKTAKSEPRMTQKPTPTANQPLAGQSFVVTGKFQRVSFEQVKALIEGAGGTINEHASHQTSYIVVGQNPGKKLKKAEKYGTPQLSEDQLMALLGMN